MMCTHSCKPLSLVGSASPPVLFRRRDLYRPLRLHRLTVSMSRPRSDLGTASVSKPSVSRRPVTPSEKPDKTLARTGRSLSSLTSSVAGVPMSGSAGARTSRAVAGVSPSTAVRDVVKSEATSVPRDTSSHAMSTSGTGSKLSRTLVKSMSADKAKPSLKTSDEHPVTARETSVSKSKSTSNVKKQAKSRTDAADKEVSKKETRTPVPAKVSSSLLFSVHD